jgi:hypothetical protein
MISFRSTPAMSAFSCFIFGAFSPAGAAPVWLLLCHSAAHSITHVSAGHLELHPSSTAIAYPQSRPNTNTRARDRAHQPDAMRHWLDLAQPSPSSPCRRRPSFLWPSWTPHGGCTYTRRPRARSVSPASLEIGRQSKGPTNPTWDAKQAKLLVLRRMSRPVAEPEVVVTAAAAPRQQPGTLAHAGCRGTHTGSGNAPGRRQQAATSWDGTAGLTKAWTAPCAVSASAIA